MENNFICSWLLYYSSSDIKPQISDFLFEIESDFQLKKLFCSSLPYIESGKKLHFDFPAQLTGFAAVFYHLSNHRGQIMDKLETEEKQSYIKHLMNYDTFSMKHHVSIIKCFMKAYVCDLAPLTRIRRAFVAMGLSNSIAVDNENFRSIQKYLLLWLTNTAVKGLQKLTQKLHKTFTEFELTKFISDSALTSQLVYCMFYYAQSKMIHYTITVPDVNVILKKESPSNDMTNNHTSIMIKAFYEFCDSQDAFPIDSDKLSSMPKDSVQVTLAIALVFHWIFGKSLKTLENLLRMSSQSDLSTSSSDKFQTRPTSIFINSNTQKMEEMKANKSVDMIARSPSGTGSLSQIFPPKKISKENALPNNINIENKHISDGETSPDIFLTPTEEEIPMTFSTTVAPTTKLLTQKPILINTSRNLLIKDENPMTISLKDEFQKKQQQKGSSHKLKVTVIPANETTWMAQNNKIEVTQIPLTPKKSSKLMQSPSQNLTKAQFNELQIQLGLKRQKIQSSLKKSAAKTGKTLEDSKQKVFFQVLNKNPVRRRSSLESDDFKNVSNGHVSENRLSLYLSHDKKSNEDLCSERNNSPKSIYDSLMKNGSNDSIKEEPIFEKNHLQTLDSLNESQSPGVKEKNIVIEQDLVNEMDECVDEIEVPQSLQEADVVLSPVHIFQDHGPEDIDYFSPPIGQTCLNNINELSILEETSASRKHSTASISSLSSMSTKSTDKILLNQEEYYKSIDILNKSLTSLQEEIRFLSKQQSTWNKQIAPVSLVSNPNFNQNAPEIISVPETPTNNVISLNDITNTPKHEQECSLNTDLFEYNSTNIPVSMSVNQSIPNTKPLFEEVSLEMSDSLLDDQVQISPKNIIILSSYSETLNINETPHCNSNVTPVNSQIFDSENAVCENIPEESIKIQKTKSVTNSSSDEGAEMSSSTDSSMSNAQPITFVISSDSKIVEAQKKKAELLARREEKRRMKIESLKQKRNEERENKLSATIDELMEREEKKRLEKEKRDSLLQKYLERKKSESSAASVNSYSGLEKRSSSVVVNSPVKLRVTSKTPRPVAVTGKQDSVGDLPLASTRRSAWFSTMKISKRNTSQSTSILNDDLALVDSTKFGVPLPPQEYTGPKLFGKRKVKTNRSVIVNAISHCCLAGSVNEALKDSVLKELADAEGTHFMILFRDARCQYRALYSFNLTTDELNLVCGSGPKKICHDMVEKFYKYNSGAKQFNVIISTKHLSPAVDAICIQSIFWNSKLGSQVLQTAVSNTSLNQSKPKKSIKNILSTN